MFIRHNLPKNWTEKSVFDIVEWSMNARRRPLKIVSFTMTAIHNERNPYRMNTMNFCLLNENYFQ